MSTILDRKSATTWQKRHDAHAPKVGEIAPVRLSDFRHKKPVALVFGSFT